MFSLFPFSADKHSTEKIQIKLFFNLPLIIFRLSLSRSTNQDNPVGQNKISMSKSITNKASRKTSRKRGRKKGQTKGDANYPPHYQNVVDKADRLGLSIKDLCIRAGANHNTIHTTRHRLGKEADLFMSLVESIGYDAAIDMGHEEPLVCQYLRLIEEYQLPLEA